MVERSIISADCVAAPRAAPVLNSNLVVLANVRFPRGRRKLVGDPASAFENRRIGRGRPTWRETAIQTIRHPAVEKLDSLLQSEKTNVKRSNANCGGRGGRRAALRRERTHALSSMLGVRRGELLRSTVACAVTATLRLWREKARVSLA